MMISPIHFSAVSREQVKKDSLIKSSEGTQVYKVLSDGSTESKEGARETVRFLVEAQNLPPRAMKFKIQMPLTFENGVNNQFDLIG